MKTGTLGMFPKIPQADFFLRDFKSPHLHMLSKKPPIRVAHLWALGPNQIPKEGFSMLSPKYKWELP